MQVKEIHYSCTASVLMGDYQYLKPCIGATVSVAAEETPSEVLVELQQRVHTELELVCAQLKRTVGPDMKPKAPGVAQAKSKQAYL